SQKSLAHGYRPGEVGHETQELSSGAKCFGPGGKGKAVAWLAQGGPRDGCPGGKSQCWAGVFGEERRSYLAISFSVMSVPSFVTLLAGFALMSIGMPVAGVRSMCSSLAGCSFLVILMSPGRTKTPGPFLPSCPLMRVVSASKTSAICFCVSSHFSAISLKTAD